jgi:hypothetical protein
MTRVALDLHETDNTFASGNWTPEEMLGYLNYAEQEFLQRTGILKSDTLVTLAPGATILVDRPANTMDIERVSFNGKYLRRQTSWDLEKEDSSWRAHTTGNPSYWHEDHILNSKFELNKIPAAGGVLRIFADSYPAPYVSSTEDLNLKDTWEIYLRWKVLSLALMKDGDAQDIGRSQYADQRFSFGIYLARRMMLGFAKNIVPEM